MQILINIPDSDVPKKQEIMSVDLHFIDGKVCECTYPFEELSTPRIGRWEKAFDEYSYWYRCSCCGNKIPKNVWGTDYFSPYCPECSAKMEVNDNDRH